MHTGTLEVTPRAALWGKESCPPALPGTENFNGDLSPELVMSRSITCCVTPFLAPWKAVQLPLSPPQALSLLVQPRVRNLALSYFLLSPLLACGSVSRPVLGQVISGLHYRPVLSCSASEDCFCASGQELRGDFSETLGDSRSLPLPSWPSALGTQPARSHLLRVSVPVCPECTQKPLSAAPINHCLLARHHVNLDCQDVLSWLSH